MTSSPVFFTWNVSVPAGAVRADSVHSVADDSTPIVPAPPLAGAFETQPASSGTTTSARTATAGATGAEAGGSSVLRWSGLGRPGGDAPGRSVRRAVDTDPASSPRRRGRRAAGGGAEPQTRRDEQERRPGTM